MRARQRQTVRACFEVSSGQQGFVRGFNLGTSVSSVRANITVKNHYSQAANPLSFSCLIPSGPKPAGRPVSIIYQSSSLLKRKFCGALRFGLAREHGTVLSKKNREKKDEYTNRKGAQEDKLKTYRVKIPQTYNGCTRVTSRDLNILTVSQEAIPQPPSRTPNQQ